MKQRTFAQLRAPPKPLHHRPRSESFPPCRRLRHRVAVAVVVATAAAAAVFPLARAAAAPIRLAAVAVRLSADTSPDVRTLPHRLRPLRRSAAERYDDATGTVAPQSLRALRTVLSLRWSA